MFVNVCFGCFIFAFSSASHGAKHTTAKHPRPCDEARASCHSAPSRIQGFLTPYLPTVQTFPAKSRALTHARRGRVPITRPRRHRTVVCPPLTRSCAPPRHPSAPRLRAPKAVAKSHGPATGQGLVATAPRPVPGTSPTGPNSFTNMSTCAAAPYRWMWSWAASRNWSDAASAINASRCP